MKRDMLYLHKNIEQVSSSVFRSGMGCNSPRVGHCETSMEGKSDTLRTACSSCRHRVAVLQSFTVSVRSGVQTQLFVFSRPLCMLYPPTAPRRPHPPAAAAQINLKFYFRLCCWGSGCGALLPFLPFPIVPFFNSLLFCPKIGGSPYEWLSTPFSVTVGQHTGGYHDT